MVATPPTFVAEYESSWTVNTSPRTVTPTISPNDCLIIAAITEDGTTQVNTPTDNLGTPLTYTLHETITISNFCFVRIWSALVAAGQSGSFTLSATRAGGTHLWGMNCLRFSGVSAMGASNKNNALVGSGGQSVSLTTTQENSVVVAFSADWNAGTGSRTWRTVNGITPSSGNGLEKTYQNVGSNYTLYGAYWSDTGAAGANTYGADTPAAQRYSLIAVELKGVIGGAPPPGYKGGFFDDI